MPATPARYTSTAMLLHWLMALLLVLAFGLGITVLNMPGLSPSKLRFVAYHKWLGVTLWGLACLRLAWRLRHAPPPLAASTPVWQRYAAHGLHGVLYALLLSIPLSGYFYSLAAGVPVVYLGLVPLPVLMEPDPALRPLLKALHFWLNMGLLVGVALHVAAALWHRFVKHDEVLQRMLP